MENKSARASRVRKVEIGHLFVPTQELYRHMENAFVAIANRAYVLFEGRGCVHGQDCDDWRQAESELLEPVKVERLDSDDAFVFVADVTGYRPEDLRVSVEPQFVRICGRITAEQKPRDQAEEAYSFTQGFFRFFKLPTRIDVSRVSAEINHDSLSVRLAKENSPREAELEEEPRGVKV